ncbi:glycosyltransferase [Nocardia goodfellowii]|uniref:Glycosyltransferase involved in cell wall biosynthesis n=1 Tax=Nocardia goodfellowii TaxID=882446 RepID=A0ABS4QUN1_9NOCA|nr:glycosyltransferase [Nocardia goodfellowii]MBP2194321.1 glycosyltransferase involved in cell wall biosynthesis [Nocardia goodfellowii]
MDINPRTDTTRRMDTMRPTEGSRPAAAAIQLMVFRMHSTEAAKGNLGLGSSAYSGIREAVRSVSAARRRPAGLANLTIFGDFGTPDTYSRANEHMVRGMHRDGVRLSAVPLSKLGHGCSSELRRIVAKSSARVDGPILFSGCVDRPEFGFLVGPDLFVRTRCESMRIPGRWTAGLNRAKAVIVPSHHVADAFRRSGVTVPIHIVPDGIDPEAFPCQDRPPRAVFTTLLLGMMRPKNEHNDFRAGICAWQEVFRDDPDARLVIKSQQGWPDCHLAADPRIHVDTLTAETPSTAQWYADADVLMVLGNEGFGTTLLEGMATGLPVIALESEGQADVCREAGDLVLSVEPSKWRPDTQPDRAFTGVLAGADCADVQEKLRWVSLHRGAAAELGRAASRWVRTHRDVWNCGPDVLAVVEEHTNVRKPLRHNPVQWPRRPLPTAVEMPAPMAELQGVVVGEDHPPLWSFQPPKQATIGLVTLWSPKIEGWARPHAEDKRAYCERHGFAFYGYTDVFTKERAPHWSKIPAVKRHLDDHDWVYWIDADAAITNFDIDLKDLCDDDYDLIVTHDPGGFNSGSFLARGNDAVREFLDAAWSMEVTDLFFEQTAMARAIALLPELRVKVLEMRRMNSFVPNFRRGDFICHPAGQSELVKIAMLEQVRASAIGR